MIQIVISLVWNIKVSILISRYLLLSTPEGDGVDGFDPSRPSLDVLYTTFSGGERRNLTALE